MIYFGDIMMPLSYIAAFALLDFTSLKNLQHFNIRQSLMIP